MERSEAISYLQCGAGACCVGCPTKYAGECNPENVNDALEMAIEALSEPQITRCKDCERCTTTYINGQMHDFCAFYHIVLVHKDESYCSWVERKRDGTE